MKVRAPEQNKQTKKCVKETAVVLGHLGDLKRRREVLWFETFAAVKIIRLTERKQ